MKRSSPISALLVMNVGVDMMKSHSPWEIDMNRAPPLPPLSFINGTEQDVNLHELNIDFPDDESEQKTAPPSQKDDGGGDDRNEESEDEVKFT